MDISKSCGMAQFRIYSRGLKPQRRWMCFPLMLQQTQIVSGGIL